jgi:ribosomal protein S12 methylthiotransferase
MNSYFLIALGCDKNIIDAEVMAKALMGKGLKPQEDPSGADIIIVHTCAFVREAKEESIQIILEMAEEKEKDTLLVVSGCLAQRYPNEISDEIPEVDLVLGVGRHGQILDHLGGERICVGSPDDWEIDSRDRIPSTPKSYSFVKISEGCNNRCSYCVIPHVRGRHRSRTVEDIVKEVKSLREVGISELNLIAQDLASYGIDRLGESRLVELIRAILIETDVPWIRLLYLHPAHVSGGLLELVASEDRVLNYLDLPIQHVNDGVLKSMNRKITKDGILSLIEEMREKIEGLYLRTSLIVGYPGEGEKEFRELLDFIIKIRFQHLGVFQYSPEEGTKAFDLKGEVSDYVKQSRYERIMETQMEISLDHNKGLLGKELNVLIEGVYANDPSFMRGRFYGQAPEVDGVVLFRGVKDSGNMARVRIVDVGPYDLEGEVVS